MCIHHYSIIQSLLIALEILYVSPLHPTTPQSLKTTYLYSLYSFAFSRMSQSWNYAAWRLFTNWLLPLCPMRLRFPHAFSWLDFIIG